VIERKAAGVNRLETRRKVDVRDGRNRGALDFQLVDPLDVLRIGVEGPARAGRHREHEQHVRAVHLGFGVEILRHVLPQN
jgi:hypothetical protein